MGGSSDFSTIFGAERGRDFIKFHQFFINFHQFSWKPERCPLAPARARTGGELSMRFLLLRQPRRFRSPRHLRWRGPRGPATSENRPPSGERPKNHQKTCFSVDIPACTFEIQIFRALIQELPVSKSEPALAMKSSAARSPRQKASSGGSEGSVVTWQSPPVRGGLLEFRHPGPGYKNIYVSQTPFFAYLMANKDEVVLTQGQALHAPPGYI